MLQHFRLKRFAKNCMATLRPMFPVQEIKNRLHDPERIGLIFPNKEWNNESPSKERLPAQKQDWVLFHGWSPEVKSRLIVFFERINEQLAVIWICLQVRGGPLLILKESCHADQSHDHVFVAGGLRLEVEAPMRHWRLAFNGILTELESGHEVHVRLNARFVSLGQPFEFPKDIAPSKFARRFEQTVESDHINKIKEAMRKATTFEGYEQPGTFYCELRLDQERTEEILWGSKVRYVGTTPLFTKCNHYFGYAANGAIFHIIESMGRKCHGFCYTPSAYMKRISKGIFVRPDHHVSLSFNVAKFEFKGRWKNLEELAIASFSATPDKSWRARTAWGDLLQTSLNGESFPSGILSIRFSEEYQIPEAIVSRLNLTRLDPMPTDQRPLFLTMEDTLCRYPVLTGGKGSSLAQLTAISKKMEKFIVPKALILTVAAYEDFAAQPYVAAAISRLLERCSHPDIDLAGIRAASEDCVRRVSKAVLPNGMRQRLQQRLLDYFGSLESSRGFAIRSSAVGEDSEEMSAAGQLSTCLCVHGMRDIENAIVQCWTSQFTLTALTYKRQYSQELAPTSGMAVVIQEMVEPDSAGVMFTCDPVSGHPNRMIVTANFGLGGSVVSATADPDSFTLLRVPSPGGLTRFSIESKSVGKKQTKVVPLPDGGTEERAMKEHVAEHFCIEDVKLLELADIGMQVEEYCDAPRDIEWAICDGKIYLLQSRPISSLFKESDFEITHDLNSALPTNREILSRANIDEVMPGAVTSMTFNLYGVLYDLFVTRMLRSRLPELLDWSLYAARTECQIGKRMFTNFSPNWLGSGRSTLDQQVLMTLGNNLTDHEVYTRGIFHPCVTPRSYKTKATRYSFKFMFSVEEIVRKSRDIAENFTVDFPASGNSRELIISFVKQLQKMRNAFPYLMGASIASQSWNQTAVNVLKGALGPRTSDAEVMSIFSKLARSDLDVESANIPSNLQNLAAKIRNSSLGENFESLDVEEALQKLQDDNGEAGNHFRIFMQRHGHRCYKEFDLYSRPWVMDPRPLIRSLQSYVATAAGAEKAQQMTLEELERRPGFVRKRILKLLLPRAQMAVYGREATKAAVVKCIHELRVALWTIGGRLEQEGRLPEAELIFFMTIDEAYRLAEERDPNLVSRAIRRRRLHPKLNKEKFDVLTCGVPRPIGEVTEEIDVNATSATGTTVSEGIVTGVARVIDDFETEAHLIERGEILITHATDTGWTPYFPLLGGVVTEIGGLLSHGAVVAREYGLPAIVGVVNATRIFRSGDVIRLDAGNATISKLRQSPPSTPVTERPMAATQKTQSREHVAENAKHSSEGYSLLNESNSSTDENELIMQIREELVCSVEDVKDLMNILETSGTENNERVPLKPARGHAPSEGATASQGEIPGVTEPEPSIDEVDQGTTNVYVAHEARTVSTRQSTNSTNLTHAEESTSRDAPQLRFQSDAEQLVEDLVKKVIVRSESHGASEEATEERRNSSQQEQRMEPLDQQKWSAATEAQNGIPKSEEILPDFPVVPEEEILPDFPVVPEEEILPDFPVVPEGSQKLRRGAAFKRKSTKSPAEVCIANT